MENEEIIHFYVPKELKKKNEIQNRTFSYNLNHIQRIFLVLDDPTSCEIAKYFSFFMIVVIVLSCISYVLATDPTIRYQPSKCPNPVCSYDTLCPDREVCEPIPPHGFNVVEIFCIVIFTTDYIIRILLVGFMPPRLAGVEQSSWDIDALLEYQQTGFYKDDPIWPPYRTMLVYIFQVMNIIDLAAILPFYLQFGTAGSSSISIVRVLRLARMFRVFKASKYNKGANLLATTMKRSFSALSLLFFFTVLGVVLFGSLIYFLESGIYTVTEEYPDGIYLRPNYLGSGLEESPYKSILVSCYWVIVTATTVGFGDLYPTTTGGRLVACICMYCGLLVLALPITIVGSNFTTVYNEKVEQEWEDENKKLLIETGLTNSNHSSQNDGSVISSPHDDSVDTEKRDELVMLPSDNREHIVVKSQSQSLSPTLLINNNDNNNNNSNNNTNNNNNTILKDPIVRRQSSHGSTSNDDGNSPHLKKLSRPPKSLSLPWELTFLQPQSQSKRQLLQEESPIPTEYSTSPRKTYSNEGQHKIIQFKGKNIIRKHITILRIVEPKSNRIKYQRFHRQKELKSLNSNALIDDNNIMNSISRLISSKNTTGTLSQFRSDLIQISNGLNQLISHLDSNINNNSTNHTLTSQPTLLQTTNIRSASPISFITTPPTPPISRQNSRHKNFLQYQQQQQQQFNTPSPNKGLLRGNLANLRSFSVSNNISQNSPSSIKSPQQIYTTSPLSVEKQMTIRSNEKSEKPSTSERKAGFKSSSSYHQLEDTG